MENTSYELLRDIYSRGGPPAAEAFVDFFRRTFGEELAAVVLYGSMLDERLASENSFYDFYLICDDYRRFFKRRRDRWLARVLPPNVYYQELAGESGHVTACKYCVISLADLKEACGPGAKDLYHLGRFSKRLALLWTRDTFERDEVLGACLQAMETLTPHAINRVGNIFTLEEFIQRALALSYEGEIRLEKTEEKVRELYESSASFYRQIWRAMLENFRLHNRALFHESQPNDEPDTYYLRRKSSLHARMIEPTDRLIRRSRRRAKLRWPKGIILLDNWLDYLLAKVERTYGVKLELTPRERRWPLILGWKHYFRLRRQGKIK